MPSWSISSPHDDEHVIQVTTPPHTNYFLACTCGWTLAYATLDLRKVHERAHEHFEKPLRCSICPNDTSDPDRICGDCKDEALAKLEQLAETEHYAKLNAEEQASFDDLVMRLHDDQDRGL